MNTKVPAKTGLSKVKVFSTSESHPHLAYHNTLT